MHQHCLTIAFLSACVLLQAASADPSAQPHDYQGSYRFPDGTIITGGRMDEGGRVMLSYLDTENVSRGGLFDTRGESYEGLFGTEASIEFRDDGRIMLWQEPDGESLRLERVMKPLTRPATFANDGVRLSGTLYLPPGENVSLPAVVLAHGSGPTTRYLGPWVTFFVGEGFAVLAFDKRGTGDSGGNWESATYFDLAADLVAAAEWLAGQPSVDASRVGLKTSSQSGWYGPHAVDASAVLGFLIQRAAPAVNIAQGTAHEIRRELEADGVPPDSIDAAVNFWLELHAMARGGYSLEHANEFLNANRAGAWFEASFGDWDSISRQWWHQHTVNMALEPAIRAARLNAPVLWFLAELDENVPYRESLAALEAAKAINPALSVITVHDAPHSFLVEEKDGTMRYSDEYWSRMSAWLKTHVAPRREAPDR